MVPAFDVIMPPKKTTSRASSKLQSASFLAKAVHRQGVIRAQEAAGFSKKQLLAAIREGWVSPFKRLTGYNVGHRATNYAK